MYKDAGLDNQPDISGFTNDEVNDTNTSKVEDLEVRMDLTDDLLHMVCAFTILFLHIQIIKESSGLSLLAVVIVVNIIIFSYVLLGFLFLGPH